MPPAKPSTKHRYIPAFYLRRWHAPKTGKLTEYSNPYPGVFPLREVTAERTGYEERLYELKGYEPELAQQVEETFFKPVDQWASDALDKLEAEGHHGAWGDHQRSAWSRVLLSLLVRCPEDIAMFREWWYEDFSRTDTEAEARYRESREPSDPATFSEYLASQPLAVKERHQFEIFYSLVDHVNVGTTLNRMHWRVLLTVPHAPTLLTSDRPVIRTLLGDKDAHIVLPIGPRLLFLSGVDADYLERVRLADPVELVKEVNRQVVEGAKRYVWGVDERHYRFVCNRFGKNPQPRVMESVVARR